MGNHDDAKKGPENVKKQNGVEEADAWKENSKNGANRGGAAATNAGPLPLDDEGLPPLRKTAVNPAFKRKSTSEDVGSAKKLPKKEEPKHKDDSKGKENGQKENLK